MHSKSELALAGELFELLELIAVQTVLNQIQAEDQAVECARAGDREISAAALAGQCRAIDKRCVLWYIIYRHHKVTWGC